MKSSSFPKKLPLEFYMEPNVLTVAQSLLGKQLCTNIDGNYTSAIITETEAYAGVNDKASHAFGGRRTQRTEIMYWQGGTAYVYLCYGIHSLFNVVSNLADIPHAVLIRAVYPLLGKEIMLERSKKTKIDKAFGIGPGKVCTMMGIHYHDTGKSLLANKIWIEDIGIEIPAEKIAIGPRIGVDYAGSDALLPYRFLIQHSELSTLLNNK